MKTPNDTQTSDMLPDGLPAFDLDPEHPWPKPDPLDAKPEPEPVAQRLKTWAARMLETRL